MSCLRREDGTMILHYENHHSLCHCPAHGTGLCLLLFRLAAHGAEA